MLQASAEDTLLKLQLLHTDIFFFRCHVYILHTYILAKDMGTRSLLASTGAFAMLQLD